MYIGSKILGHFFSQNLQFLFNYMNTLKHFYEKESIACNIYLGMYLLMIRKSCFFLILNLGKFKSWQYITFSCFFQLEKPVVKDLGVWPLNCQGQGDCSNYRHRLLALWQEMYQEQDWYVFIEKLK